MAVALMSHENKNLGGFFRHKFNAGSEKTLHNSLLFRGENINKKMNAFR